MTQLEGGGAWIWTHSLTSAVMLNHSTIEVEFALSSKTLGSPALGLHKGEAGPTNEQQHMGQMGPGWYWSPGARKIVQPCVHLLKLGREAEAISISYRWETGIGRPLGVGGGVFTSSSSAFCHFPPHPAKSLSFPWLVSTTAFLPSFSQAQSIIFSQQGSNSGKTQLSMNFLQAPEMSSQTLVEKVTHQGQWGL